MSTLFSTDPIVFTPAQKVLALSWKQPFAELMLHGKIETRTWPTKYRGWVLICASKTGYSHQSILNIAGPEQYLRFVGMIDTTKNRQGMAIAIGRLIDCRRMRPDDEDACFVQYRPYLYCHVYADVQEIAPISWVGSQGWKEVSRDIKALIQPLKFYCLDEGDGKPRCQVQCPFCENLC